MDLKKDMEIAGVAPEHYDEIVRNLKESKKLFKKVSFYKWTAPIVMLFIAPFLKWHYNKLVEVLERQPFKLIHKLWPGFYEFIDNYDNNISINGDRLEWQYDDNGVYYGDQKFSYKPAPLEDTPEARKLNYYAFGLHPRHNVARYVWLGFRNRASKKALKIGPTIPRTIPLISYEWKDDKGNYIGIYNIDTYWQYARHKPIIKGRFSFRTNLGYKLDNFHGDLTEKVMVTYKDFAIIRNK